MLCTTNTSARIQPLKTSVTLFYISFHRLYIYRNNILNECVFVLVGVGVPPRGGFSGGPAKNVNIRSIRFLISKQSVQILNFLKCGKSYGQFPPHANIPPCAPCERKNEKIENSFRHTKHFYSLCCL